jgi:hypothetical protein
MQNCLWLIILPKKRVFCIVLLWMDKSVFLIRSTVSIVRRGRLILCKLLAKGVGEAVGLLPSIGVTSGLTVIRPELQKI